MALPFNLDLDVLRRRPDIIAGDCAGANCAIDPPGDDAGTALAISRDGRTIRGEGNPCFRAAARSKNGDRNHQKRSCNFHNDRVWTPTE